MKRFVFLVLLFAAPAFAQNSDVPKACVILAANAPATGIATWSREGSARKHLLTYLSGSFPPGVPFRSQIKDKEVDKIKAKGGRVIILDTQYTREDLDKAKQECSK